MSPRPCLPLVSTLVGLLGLACMCGGPSGPDPGTVPGVGFDEQDPAWGAPTEPGADPAQLAYAPEAPPAGTVPASARGFAPSIRGVCEMEQACGCLEKESVDACEASLQKSAVVFDSITLSCITTQACASMCGGGGVRCVEEASARLSAAESARHNAVMNVMNNYPSGGPCPSGMVETVNYAGQHVGCR